MEDWHRIVFFLTVYSICMGEDVVYHVPEEVPNNTYIGNIANDSNINSVISETDFNNMRFNFLTQGNEYAKYFHIDDKTSDMFTQARLDREQLCPFVTLCILTFEVVVQSSSGHFFRTLKVRIYLEDINDHSPSFAQKMLSIPISEDVVVGTQYPIEGAIDLDNSDKYSLYAYELVPNNLPFSIQFVKNLDGSSLVRLSVKQPLDREKEELYNMVLLGKDGGDPPLTGRLIINVTVTDVNDNSPQFTSPMYNVSVNENVENGSVILTVAATDLDEGENGLVHYRFSAHQANEIFQLFAIDEETGEMRVIGELLYTYRKVYTVIVKAFDLSDNPLTNQTLIYVSVEDSGNNPPEIHVNTFTNSDDAAVSELAKPGTVVAHVSVVDHDTGKDGEVVCVTDSDSFEIEPLPEKYEYTVIVAHLLDHERQNMTDVTVNCQDNGDPPLMSSLIFVVEILDENDNSPRFTKPLYETSIYENNKLGESIVTVTADDIDSGTNADIVYRLSSSGSEYVYIEKSGMIRAKISLDRELTSVLDFLVYAVDGGSPQRTGSAIVRIQILDENDEKPIFNKDSYEFSISENRPSETIVGMLLASDGDTGPNAMILYMIYSFYNQNIPFVVSPDGVIQTNAQLDREVVDNYDFNVTAIDEGFPALNSSVHVKVIVNDENDNPPKIYFPSPSNDTVRVPFMTTPWTVICGIQASDDDEPGNENSRLKYEITNEFRLLRINFDTGDIQVTDFITKQKYDLGTFRIQIVVSDHGIPDSLSSTAMLTLQLYPENVTQAVRVGDEEGQPNIIIAVIVGVVTVVISGCIVIIICVVRKLGIKKQQQQLYFNDAKQKKVFDESITVFSLPSDNRVQEERKGKVVSFMLDDNLLFGEELVQHKDNTSEYKTFKPTISLSFSKPIGESNVETCTMTTDGGRGMSGKVNHLNSFRNCSSPRLENRVGSPTFQQEIIPFSFKKALNTPGHLFQEARDPLKLVFIHSDSGIHCDGSSHESDLQGYISKDVVV
ncbi:hypothetical protein CHS0354_000933 [Potamilus streckersoni]|uniref:Cadherin domain-containing protein n=1 Tax=Potamilus streckersoni TaxID=2493646 RepID=A0AAE0SRJ5_9BIVA|nr:hypothetical protein CHS0354_000933 [Potamilus streckersoni]